MIIRLVYSGYCPIREREIWGISSSNQLVMKIFMVTLYNSEWAGGNHIQVLRYWKKVVPLWS